MAATHFDERRGEVDAVLIQEVILIAAKLTTEVIDDFANVF